MTSDIKTLFEKEKKMKGKVFKVVKIFDIRDYVKLIERYLAKEKMYKIYKERNKQSDIHGDSYSVKMFKTKNEMNSLLEKLKLKYETY